MPDIRPVILSGGSGTRLWPVSTPDLPKQFARLVGEQSLFERALLRLDGAADVVPPMIVTGAEQLTLVQQTCAAAGVEPHLVIVEPTGRNTAPAAIAAALMAHPRDVLAILASDHLIEDRSGFVSRVEDAASLAQDGYIVTFGITPARPETGYGYIETGAGLGDAMSVKRFKEKPTEEEAERLASDGKHVWNSGMFVVTAQALVDEAEAHCPEVLSVVRSAIGDTEGGVLELGERFADVESISLDHAIMEKTRRAAVMPISVGWDDVGSFEALWGVSTKDDRGNAVFGDVRLLDVDNSLVHSSSRRVAVIGVRDVVVVETPDAVLVVPRERAQDVREIVNGIDPD